MWAAAGAGDLGLPSAPRALAPRIRSLGPGAWGSAEHDEPLRGLGTYAYDFEASKSGPRDDYVIAGVEGIATGLEAVHYHVAVGRAGLFVQTHSGQRGRATLALAGQVQDLAMELDDAGLLGSDGQLVVLHSDFGTRWWKWTGADPQGDSSGLIGALEWLQERAAGG